MNKDICAKLTGLTLLASLALTQPGLCQESVTKVASSHGKLKVGLCLGGGGTRGGAHVGVLKVFEEEGIPVDMVVGTSIGAIVGGMYSAGVPVEDITSDMLGGKVMKSFMTVPIPIRVLAAPIMVIPRLWSHPYDGLYKGNLFRNYMLSAIPPAMHNIENLKIPFAAVAFNIRDCQPYAIESGNIGYAIQASSAVPGLRKPVEIGDKLFVDGGVVANLPVEQTRAKGADIVIAVDIDERLPYESFDSFRKMGSVTKRMVTYELHHDDEPATKMADILIHPNVDGIGLVSTKKKDMVRAYEAGIKAAREAMPAIKAKLQQVGLTSLRQTQ